MARNRRIARASSRARKRAVIFVVLMGCGSSSEPQQHPAPDVGVVELDTAPPPPPKSIRTLKTVGLFGETTTDNLFINPTFEPNSPGLGQWYSSYGVGISLDGPELSQLVLSDSPSGTALAVGSIADAPATGSPRTFSLVSQVPGGPGPFVLSTWISTETALSDDIANYVRVSIVGAKTTGLTGTEVPHESTRTIAGRVWHRYRAEMPGPYSMGAYVVIRFKGSRNQWYLQAPELVPKKLLPASEAALIIGRPFDLAADERGAIAAYKKKLQGVPMSASK
jgi:hypothetical protein